MTLFMLSLTGIPPLAGFFGKFYVILAAVEVGQSAVPLAGWMTALAILTMLNATVAAFYYLRVVVYMFMRDPGEELPRLRHGRLVWGGLAISTVLTIVLGLFPNLLLTVVGDAAAVFTDVVKVAGS
jgi:NADH-quinone oxidoreductase subunit N